VRASAVALASTCGATPPSLVHTGVTNKTDLVFPVISRFFRKCCRATSRRRVERR
jgi:hypothetical protein